MRNYLKPEMDIKKYQLDIISICGPSGGGGTIEPEPPINTGDSMAPTDPGNN